MRRYPRRLFDYAKRLKMAASKVGRPYAPGYGIPQTAEGVLPWTHVEQRLTQARNYWMVTVQPDGSPHTVPIWGAWHDGALYMGGQAGARWVRNLKANPQVVVHLESGDDVVILKGEVYEERDQTLMEQVDAIYYGTKYGGAPPDPSGEGGWLAMRPKVVIAWTAFPTNATRWTFDLPT
jgi:hypothetical protein